MGYLITSISLDYLGDVIPWTQNNQSVEVCVWQYYPIILARKANLATPDEAEILILNDNFKQWKQLEYETDCTNSVFGDKQRL
jgi:hypothetical protein